MLKNLRVKLNNMNQKPYIKGKGKFKLYSSDEKNLTPLSKDSEEMRRITDLETRVRYKNLKVYKSSMAKLRRRQASLVTIPVLLGCLTVFTWKGQNYVVTESLPTYQRSVIEMDEEYLYKDEVDPINYVKTVFPRTYVGNPNVERIDSTAGKAIINFGLGENAAQVEFTVNDDGTWNYSSYETEPFFDLDGRNEDDAKEIPSKYDNIIEEAAKIFKSKLSKRSKTYELIDEILSNNKNDIIVTIERYEYLGDLTYETSRSYWLFRILTILCDVVAAYILLHNREKLNTLPALDSYRGELMQDDHVNLFYAALQYKESLLQAETERISEIDSIIKKNNGTGEILSKFEKKLIKQ